MDERIRKPVTGLFAESKERLNRIFKPQSEMVPGLTPEQIQEQWFEAATHEQIQERVLEGYVGLAEGVDRFTASLSVEDTLSYLERTGSFNSGEYDKSLMDQLKRDNLVPEIADYQLIMGCAYKRLINDGVKTGDLLPAQGLVTRYRESFYAKRLLELLAGASEITKLVNRGAEFEQDFTDLLNAADFIKRTATKEHNAKVRQDFYFGKGKLMKSIRAALSLSKWHQGKRIKREEDSMKQSLREISSLPPVPIQLLRESLSSSPVTAV